MHKKTIRDVDVKGKRILVRVDYNVPVKDGRVGDTLRIKASFDTINYLLDQGCSLVLISHLGEPKEGPDPALSLRPVAEKVSELLGRPVDFMPDCVGNEIAQEVSSLQPGDIVLLENLRFHPEETANDPAFAKQLASYGEVFVNDAFAVEHRKHASVVGVPQYLPAVAGLLVEKEVTTIVKALEDPKRPLVSIVAGAKISSKIEVLTNLLQKVNGLVIGGAMANTFLAAQGQTVGKSLQEPDQYQLAKQILVDAKEHGVEVVLPVDVVTSKSREQAEAVATPKVADVQSDDWIVDVGPKTVRAAAELVKTAGTVIWNGPLGITEIPEFAKASLELAKLVADGPAFSLIGGGDTAAFIDAAGMHDQFDFISTGGGASLELMAGKTLPGVEALQDK